MKKIAVITGSRADFGLLNPVCRLIEKSNLLELHLFVTGSHLSKLHGNTLDEIAEEKFKSMTLVNLNLDGDSAANTSKYLSISIEKFTKHFMETKPDIVLILGDRYEIFGAAIASLMCNTFVAHIHGGELTQGAIDDALRHSITKMSHLHFTSHEVYKNRVLQLGEKKELVFNFGSLGAEIINNYDFLSKKQLENILDIEFIDRNLLITFHPETTDQKNTLNNLNILLNALGKIRKKTNLIFTMPNADPGHIPFFKEIHQFINKCPETRFGFQSLGQKKYYSILNYVDGVIGNSSSGIIEVPSFKIPTVNIGSRQKGRIMSESIINVNPNESEILEAVNSIFNVEFRNKLKLVESPYFKSGTAENILRVLEKDVTLSLEKTFFDLY